jgi:hypothetical protein
MRSRFAKVRSLARPKTPGRFTRPSPSRYRVTSARCLLVLRCASMAAIIRATTSYRGGRWRRRAGPSAMLPLFWEVWRHSEAPSRRGRGLRWPIRLCRLLAAQPALNLRQLVAKVSHPTLERIDTAAQALHVSRYRHIGSSLTPSRLYPPQRQSPPRPNLAAPLGMLGRQLVTRDELDVRLLPGEQPADWDPSTAMASTSIRRPR